jgi:hypothetical protein
MGELSVRVSGPGFISVVRTVTLMNSDEMILDVPLVGFVGEIVERVPHKRKRWWIF